MLIKRLLVVVLLPIMLVLWVLWFLQFAGAVVWLCNIEHKRKRLGRVIRTLDRREEWLEWLIEDLS